MTGEKVVLVKHRALASFLLLSAQVCFQPGGGGGGKRH